MPVRVVVPPEPVISLEDAKWHLRVDTSGDDMLIAGFIEAVTQHIVSPTGWLGRSVSPQTLELSLPAFCGRNMGLPYGPVIEVVSLKYLDPDALEQTVSAEHYRVVDGRIWLRRDFTFPAAACEPDAVRIRYRAGYDGDAEDFGVNGPPPEAVRAAIMLHVAALYENRSQIVVGDSVATLPPHAGADALLSTFRIY